MTTPMFDTPDAPGSGDRFINAEHVGELLVIRVKEVAHEVVTDAGTSDVIVADVTVIDGPNAGTEYLDAWVFGKVVMGQLKRKVGRTIVGRWYGEPGVKRQGKNVAYQINPATDEETAYATKFMTERMRPDAPAQAASVGAGSSEGPAATDLGETPPWTRRG